MNGFAYRNGILHCEDKGLDDIVREQGTPTFVYSRAALESAYRAYDGALAGHPHQICYAVKANSNLALLNVFARLGAGFDIVSGGELERVLAAGGVPGKIMFSGVGKRRDEMAAALKAGIHCFNAESENELRRLDAVAGELGLRAPVSLRVNPDVDAKTHPYIATGLKENKFGVAHTDALRVYRLAASLPNLDIIGIDCHIGSQLTEVAPFIDALDRVLDLMDRLAVEGIRLSHIDLGGGLGVRYRDELPPSVTEYAAALIAHLADRPQTLILEPGRSLVANAGVLLTRVEYLKHTPSRNFAVVDAAMNDLMRPALYEAWHDIKPVVQENAAASDVAPHRYDVVGPVCESGDVLARDRDLALGEGDLLAIFSAGAYGMSMSSNYNARTRASEVLVDGGVAHLVRRRETIADLFAHESIAPL